MGKQSSFIKRLIDVIISILVLLITSPVFLLVCLAIKLESKGPALFIQERTGLNGEHFNLVKFRGMIDNALLHGPELTQINDPRVTKVGKFLRRTSIDEIPNFINVRADYPLGFPLISKFMVMKMPGISGRKLDPGTGRHHKNYGTTKQKQYVGKIIWKFTAYDAILHISQLTVIVF